MCHYCTSKYYDAVLNLYHPPLGIHNIYSKRPVSAMQARLVLYFPLLTAQVSERVLYMQDLQ